jgi:hypothetical protein
MVFAASSVFAASVVNMTIASKTAPKDLKVAIPITVDVSTAIAGAAFTLVYDTTALDVTIDSKFFDTFAVQSADAKTAGYAGMTQTTVTVDGTTYAQPFIDNDISGTGTKIAAARAVPAAAGLTTPLFTLHVSLKSGATPKAYTISVVPTQYTLDGSNSNINLIIGSDLTKAANTADAYPVKLDAADYASHLTPGTVTFRDVIAGDVMGTGVVNTFGLVKFKNYLLLKGTLTDTEKNAADIDGNGTPNTFDFIKMKLLYLGTFTEL